MLRSIYLEFFSPVDTERSSNALLKAAKMFFKERILILVYDARQELLSDRADHLKNSLACVRMLELNISNYVLIEKDE